MKKNMLLNVEQIQQRLLLIISCILLPSFLPWPVFPHNLGELSKLGKSELVACLFLCVAFSSKQTGNRADLQPCVYVNLINRKSNQMLAPNL